MARDRAMRYIIMFSYAHERFFNPLEDVHGQAVAYPTRTSAAPDLYRARELYGRGNVYLAKYGPYGNGDKLLRVERPND